MKLWIKTLLLAKLAFLAGVNPVFASSERAGPDQPPALSVEKKTLHFSFPEKGNLWQEYHGDAVSLKSNEYWFQVSATDLKTGVDIDLSDPGALVRFSALAKQQSPGSKSSGAGRAEELDIKKLEVFRNNRKLPFAIESMASGKDIPEESLLSDSSILQLNPAVGAGRLTIRSTQKLYREDQYLVYVKENNSSKKLYLSAPRLHMLAGDIFSFNAALIDEQMGDGQGKIADDHYQSYLVSPVGKKTDVTMKGGVGDSWSIRLPSILSMSGPGELYELYIDAEAAGREGQLKRKAKLTVAIARPSAQLETVRPVFTLTRGVAANVTLNVATEGRYEVRGTIYGTDDVGKLRSIMRSHSAYWLRPGVQDIELQMDTGMLESSGLKAPYRLMDFQLLDQSQLAVLHSESITN